MPQSDIVNFQSCRPSLPADYPSILQIFTPSLETMNPSCRLSLHPTHPLFCKLTPQSPSFSLEKAQHLPSPNNTTTSCFANEKHNPVLFSAGMWAPSNSTSAGGRRPPRRYVRLPLTLQMSVQRIFDFFLRFFLSKLWDKKKKNRFSAVKKFYLR